MSLSSYSIFIAIFPPYRRLSSNVFLEPEPIEHIAEDQDENHRADFDDDSFQVDGVAAEIISKQSEARGPDDAAKHSNLHDFPIPEPRHSSQHIGSVGHARQN